VPLGQPLWALAMGAHDDGHDREDSGAGDGGDGSTGGAPGAGHDAGGSTDLLRRQLQAHAQVPALRLTLGIGGRPAVWLLRALPRTDAQGRFAGHVGSARAVELEESASLAQATLAQLWPLAGGALLLFRPEPAAGGVAGSAGTAPATPVWRLREANAEALRLLALEPGTAGLGQLDWPAVAQRLPEALAQALADLPPGQDRVLDEGQLRWEQVPGPQGQAAARLLVLSRPQAGATAAAPASDSADHESFIYSVSHDLRAPIRVVEGFARILKEDYGRALDRIGNDHVDRVLAAAARMNSMIESLLALSRLQSQPLKRQPVDLSQLSHYVLEDLRRQFPERQVEQQIEPGIVVHGDPTLMRIAVENLIGNAWKYSGQNPQARIAMRREQKDGQAVIVVEDNGAGFDMRFADRLFGVFQRLHSAKDFQGTGVGLASVRRIMRRHGGDIWAESEVGKGAKFFFTLP